MKLAFGSLLFLVATAAAAALSARPNNPIATAPELSTPSSSVPQEPTTIPVPSSDPSGTNNSPTGSSGPVSPTDVSSASTDTSVPTSATSVQESSTEAKSQTSSTDSLTSTGDAPTVTPEQRSITSHVTSTTSSDVPPPSLTSRSLTSSTAPSQPTTTAPTVDKQTYLNQHNRWRALVGAADLQWSDDLAAKAQSYAEQCQLRHSNGALGQVGENLVAGTGSFDVDDAMSQFVLDRRDFNPGDLTFSHFTQVIWSSTTQLGCGVAVCDKMFPGQGDATYHVCLYDPVGNVIGEELSNLPHFG